MPLQATSGAASYDAFGGGGAASGPATYIEDVFSTYLYTGTGSTLTITNGINLSTIGGLVWIKRRNSTGSHQLFDTNRGNDVALASNLSSGNETGWTTYFNFQSTGFGLGPNGYTTINDSGGTYASWTFEKQPKFFDVVTFTSSASGNKTFSHNLGAVPGCVLIKNTQTSDAWIVYHRSVGDNAYLQLNTTAASISSTGAFSATSTTFTIASALMYNSQTYVAYLFAHDAGGFGLTGTDNVISCGSYTGNGSASGPTVTLGYEPQWVVWKAASSGTESWHIRDVMRGMPVTASGRDLYADSSSAEAGTTNEGLIPTATGLQVIGTNTNANANGVTYIYIAIRRGPMKVPTTGTSVFAPITGNFSSPYTVTTNFPVDLTISSSVTGSTRAVNDRLRGGTTTSYNYLNTTTTSAESTGTGAGLGFQNNTAVIDNNWQTGSNALWWNFQRAPSFFDEVCYTGTGANRTVTHNLGVVPELYIVKARSSVGDGDWWTYSSTLGATKYLRINLTSASGTLSSMWNNTSPTATNFSIGTYAGVNQSSSNYVAYLFATCAGVSKVGSYTGTGATQTIDCGFGAGGARFALIKRTDSTGDWWVWDSARGMVAGTDPRIDLNAGSPQTNANWVYTISTGFQIVTTDASVNASGGTYIFLAIA